MPTIQALQEELRDIGTHISRIQEKFNGSPVTGAELETLNTEFEGWVSKGEKVKNSLETASKAKTITDWLNGLADLDFSVGAKTQATRADLYYKAFKKYLTGDKNWQNSAEYKAYQADDPGGGGYTIVPQILANQILTLMKNLVFVRQYATVQTLENASSLGVVAIDTDPSDSDWTPEIQIGQEETTLAFGKRELVPTALAKWIKLTRKLLAQSPNIQNLILDRLTYKMRVAEEKSFLTGNGAAKPLGLFVPSNDGIPASRDTVAASATTLAGDDIVGTYFSLLQNYEQNAVWILNRNVVRAIRTLKDTNGNYIWAAGYGGSNAGMPSGPGGGLQYVPSTLMGRPILESVYAPGTISTGQYVALYGDLSYYWIADAMSMTLQVLIEYFAPSNQVGYVLRKETDGMPVQAEAFSRLRMA